MTVCPILQYPPIGELEEENPKEDQTEQMQNIGTKLCLQPLERASTGVRDRPIEASWPKHYACT